MKPSRSAATAANLPSEGVLVTEVSAARRAIIEQSAIALGRTWADVWRQGLRREGRPASGGWPGTMREARARVECTLQVEMHCRELPPMTEVEREFAARTAYASARIEWRRIAEPETR